MAWETRTEWNTATNPKLTDPYGTMAVPDIQTNRAIVPRPASGNVWSALFGTGGEGTTAYMLISSSRRRGPLRRRAAPAASAPTQ